MLITFSGPMGSGKSTAIKQFVSRCPQGAELVKFAQPLYDMQEYIYNRIKDVHVRPSSFVKDRKLLQWLGTDWGRDTIQQDLWVAIWKAEVAKHLSKGRIVVCDDVRFDNEAIVVKEMKGVIIKITTTKASTLRADGGEGIKQHASELGIANEYADFVVENTGTLQEYQDKLDKIFDSLTTKAY